ncbi:hypothetical protein EKO04_006375 [Ascochyta lentis]|uniref:Uncharacterized protein n=1 Tax=Ascochyta lentis TaxID=205686 RepID=A0A8H7MGM1_9PLEO|nr:hypothetical protein EKO04_006375 [Ascochyta lentis]
MADRGEYQKQMAALLAAAKAKNLKFEEILPEDMLGHSKEMTELKAARELIKQLDDRGKELQAANETLTKNLKKKQKEIDDLPEEFKALKVELQQIQRQIVLHKTMSEDSQERAERYQRQLKEFTFKQQTDTSNANQVERLQVEVGDLQTLIAKLLEENRSAEATSAQLHESDLKALAQKDKQLAIKEKELAEKNELLAKICKELVDGDENDPAELNDACSLMFSDTETLVGDPSEDPLVMQQERIDLMQQNLDLEKQIQDLKEQITATKSQLDQTCSSLSHEQTNSPTRHEGQLSASVISEMKPLNRFYKAVSQIVNAFAMIFQATSANDIPSLSHLGAQLDMAQHALDEYMDIKNMMRASIEEWSKDDMDHIALRSELDDLASSATESQIKLEVINMGFWTFLNQLSYDPKMLSNLNGALCDAERIDIDGY